MHKLSIVAVFIILCALFYPAFHFFAGWQFFEVQNGLITALSIGLLIGFSGVEGRAALKAPMIRLAASDALLSGVIFVKLGLIIIFFNLWLWRLETQPSFESQILNHWTGAFGRWVLVIGELFLLASSRSIKGRIPARIYMVTGSWVALGIALAAIAITVGNFKLI